ncbi:MAG: hypothetical protein RIF32_23740, partial [Leptospirales bacterium]
MRIPSNHSTGESGLRSSLSLAAVLAFALIAGSVALIAQQPESAPPPAGPEASESRRSPLPGILLCEKAMRCQAEAKDDPTFFDDCESFVQRAQAHPKAVDKMAMCADAAACAEYKFVDCIQVYAGELSAAGLPESEFREILTGRQNQFQEAPKLTAEQLTEFDELCATVVKCDVQTQSFPDPKKVCMQFLVSIEQRYPEKSPGLHACLRGQSCEEQNFADCLA